MRSTAHLWSFPSGQGTNLLESPWRISVVKYELHKTNCGGVFHWGVGEVRCANWRQETILLHS